MCQCSNVCVCQCQCQSQKYYKSMAQILPTKSLSRPLSPSECPSLTMFQGYPPHSSLRMLLSIGRRWVEYAIYEREGRSAFTETVRGPLKVEEAKKRLATPSARLTDILTFILYFSLSLTMFVYLPVHKQDNSQ